jgi:signal transduction histidine kinase
MLGIRAVNKVWGLAVVKGVADSHGWKITVESEKGNGSCFKIIILWMV